MNELFAKLFDKSMMPHGHCYLWNDNLVGLHVISDVVIAISYFTIPLALIILVRKREDLQFNYIFLFFALFIFACGATHVIAIYNVWNGAYWLSGTVKAITAGASVVTAVLVWPLLPKALALPSTSQLIEVNSKLTEEVEANKRLSDRLEDMIAERERQAVRDPLTTLLNRRGFEERWPEHVALAKRTGEPLMVMMIDLDHFKRVNDSYGHAMGDEVLKHFSGLLKQTVRTSDVPARIGGEEFIVALPNTTIDDAKRVAERVRLAMEVERFASDGGHDPISVTCSIGIAEHLLSNSLTETMRLVDVNLYRAKDAGRNQVCADKSS